MRQKIWIGLVAAALAATGAAAGPGAPRVASQVSGLTIVPLDRLPAAPAAGEDQSYCTHLLVETLTTPAGRAVQDKGWGVTGEVALAAGLTAVSFVGTYAAATSGTCELSDGNVGLFAGDQLVALVYATEPGTSTLAYVQPFGNQGGARLFSGDVVPATEADLRALDLGAAGLGILVTPPALEERLCQDAATVPLIDGLPIDLARALLTRAGWQADPAAGAQRSPGQAQDLAAAGFPEVEDCSGTGFGFCAFSYTGPAGQLSVTTMGEMGEDGSLPIVAGASVTCATP